MLAADIIRDAVFDQLSPAEVVNLSTAVGLVIDQKNIAKHTILFKVVILQRKWLLHNSRKATIHACHWEESGFVVRCSLYISYRPQVHE